jgi:hypothetical protein
MSPAEPSLLIMLVTVVGTGIGSAYLTQRLVRHRDESMFKRQKIEELYFALRDYFKIRSTRFALWLNASEGRSTAQEASDRCDQLIPPDEAFGKVRMIMGTYFPTLNAPLRAVSVRAGEVETLIDKFQSGFQPEKNYAVLLREAMNAFGLAVSYFYEIIFEEAADIGSKNFIKICLRRRRLRKEYGTLSGIDFVTAFFDQLRSG